MTKLLEKAINQLRTLPKMEQDALAQLLLDEVSWEMKDISEDGKQLSYLAAEALEEYRKGKTKPIGK